MNNYHVGQLVHLSCAFTNAAGAAADPTTITLKVLDPSGNTDTYTYALAAVTKDSTGNYSKDITVDEAGTWYWRWVGGGTVTAADEGEFEVAQSRLA